MKTTVNKNGQHLIYLPSDTFKHFPDDRVYAEFYQGSATQLTLRIVGENQPLVAKRYKLVKHNGSVWVSVPRYWVGDMNLAPDDSIDVQHTIDPLAFNVTVSRGKA